MKLNRRNLRSMILNEIKGMQEQANKSNPQMNKLCQQIQAASDTAGIVFEEDGDELIQTIEMILENLKKICDRKKQGGALSGDLTSALLKHVKAIKPDVDA